MGLISEFAEVKIVANNVKYWENLGYNIPRRIAQFEREKYDLFKKILIKTIDLPKHSLVKVLCRCDGTCGNNIEMPWVSYLTYVKEDGKIFCRVCANKRDGEIRRVARLGNSLSFYDWCIKNNREDLFELWSENQEINPKEISFSSITKVFFHCSKKIHKDIKISLNRITSRNSDICCNECNSLGYNYPQSNIVWSSKNKNTTLDYSKKSDKKVWWKCENNKHPDYQRIVRFSVRSEFRCMLCVSERKESFLQEKVRNYLETIPNVVINHENLCVLECRNELNNGYRLYYDNEIIFKNFKIIIEVNGDQHYRISPFHYMQANKKKTSPEEEFEYSKNKDELKKNFALDNGYYYLDIPYWTDNKDEDWKRLIDDKIKEINEEVNSE